MPEINWDELQFEFLIEYEKTHEEWRDYSAKGELLNEMITERYAMKDFESETVKFLNRKLDVIREQRDKFYDVQKYLGNMKDDFPFNIRKSVYRQMNIHGLTREQAELFLSVHRSHKAAMGTENQRKYHLANVRKVEWNDKENCLHVHYDDIWWHYDSHGQWW